MQRSLNIISGHIPCQSTLGDAQQTYWLLEALSAAGIQVHLYTFSESDPTIDKATNLQLAKICSSIKSYPIHQGHLNFSFSAPYATSKYLHTQLINDLKENNFPILIEGMGPCGLALSTELEHRKIWVRLLTYAPNYFRYLQERSSALLKKLFYQREAVLSKRILKKINPRVNWIVTSETDKQILDDLFLGGNIQILAPFKNSNTSISSKTGLGNYCLFQGNLSDAATHKTARWLLTHVFHNLKVPFVITGNNPSPSLVALAHSQPHTCIVANPSSSERQDMIEKAQIIIQPSFIKGGADEALLEGVKNGRHCLTNTKSATSTLGACYHQGTSANAFQEIIIQLYHHPFSEEEIETRKRLIATEKTNDMLAKECATIIWG
ncbi:MAG: hypothetical protein RL099_1713 [Bacteroidota bacterium]